ncbi:MAG: murein biosynthesis integral membrane protein MurJ [Clostridioides sp.]|jgi:putative peptidoglycan lipid II flippase|nr:murein biosynthesis integral membrane protein MurJ [Clostridioides sp.]
MSKTAKAAMWIMAATMLSKVLGFGRQLVLTYFYGTGKVSDVFIATINIPGLIIAIIGSAIATTFVPLYFKEKEAGGDEAALKFTNNVLNICYVIAIVIAIFGLVFTRQFVTLFSPGFVDQPDKFKLAVNFTRILISGVLFISGSKVFSSYLQVNNSFAIPSLIGLPYNIIIITSIVISGVTDKLYILPIGALIAMASQLVFQLPFAAKHKFKYKPYLHIKDESIVTMFKMMAPMLLGVSIGQINIFVDRALASGLSEGKLSALDCASRLNDFVIALFVTSIVTVIYPKMSKLKNRNDNAGFLDTVVTSANFVILVVLPIAVGFIILAEPIVRILFQRGKFDAYSTQITVIALRLFALGLVATGVRDILYRAFYTLSDTKIPMINSSIALIFNIVLNLILIKPFGHAGLAFSTSLATVVTVVLLFFSLKKKIGSFGGSKIIKTGIKSAVGSAVMGFVAYFLYNWIHTALGSGLIKEILSVSVATVVGAVIYLGIITLLKVREVDMLFDMVKGAKKKLLRH